jgi:hypothetical protein
MVFSVRMGVNAVACGHLFRGNTYMWHGASQAPKSSRSSREDFVLRRRTIYVIVM